MLGEGRGLWGDSCLTNLEVFTQGENENANMGKPGFVFIFYLNIRQDFSKRNYMTEICKKNYFLA